MFGKRCSLCGGKLNSNNICTECGLDNSKSDKNYKLNESDCDHQPLTHVHDDRTADRWQRAVSHASGQEIWKSTGRPKNFQNTQTGHRTSTTRTTTTRQTTSRTTRPHTRRRILRPFIFIVIFIWILFSVIGSIFNTIRNSFEDSNHQVFKFLDNSDQVTYDYDPYEYVNAELPTNGEQVEYTLDSGNYVVGVHIPAGNYQAIAEYDFDAVKVEDWENGIFFYTYKMDDDNLMDDIRLYDGAVVTITTQTKMTLRSDNAQTQDMHGQANPLAGTSYQLSGEQEVIVGDQNSSVKIEPGVYDFHVLAGGGMISIEIKNENGDYIDSDYLSMADNTDVGMEFKNYVLPANAVISWNDGISFELRASETIESTDYFGFYSRY